MDYKAIIQDLSEFLEICDCRAKDGLLQIYQPPFGNRTRVKNRRQDGWKIVAKIEKLKNKNKSPVKIEVIHWRARGLDYIKALDGETYANLEILECKVRSEMFRHEAKKMFKKYLSAEMKQLEDAD